MKNAEQPNKNPGAIPETAGNSHVIEITWNRGAANAVTAEYDFPSKAVADAFVRGAKEALAAPWRRWFEVRHVTPPDPSLGPPQELCRIVDKLWLFLDGLPDADDKRRAESCVNYLRAGGLAQAFCHAAPDAFLPPYVRGSRSTYHALAGLELDWRPYVLWTSSDACGVNPCASLAPHDLAEAFGNREFGKAYVRSTRGEHETVEERPSAGKEHGSPGFGPG